MIWSGNNQVLKADLGNCSEYIQNKVNMYNFYCALQFLENLVLQARNTPLVKEGGLEIFSNTGKFAVAFGQNQ